jgi:hypothetical protein
MNLDKRVDRTFAEVGVVLSLSAVILFACVAVILAFSLPVIYTETAVGIVPNEVPREFIEMAIN